MLELGETSVFWDDLCTIAADRFFFSIAMQSDFSSQGEIREQIHLDFDRFLIRFNCKKCQT